MTPHRLPWGACAAVFSIALLAACATPRPDRPPPSLLEIPSAALIEAVPFHAQGPDQCGPASLAMVLNWTGDPVTPEQIAPHVYTPARKGSLKHGLVTAARRRARVPYPVRTQRALMQEVAAGSPVVVLQNLGFWWYEVWHYAVVVGYDLPGEQIFLHTGQEFRKPVPLRLFDRTWARADRWGIVVLPPERLPASAEEKPFLEAVLGLERAEQWRAASEAYEAAATKWPTSLGALIGLGNSRTLLGDLAGAEGAFRRATHEHPESGPAFNNLAHVLAAQGRNGEALVAAERAVSLGGASAPLYEQTLRQIQTQAP